MAGRLGSQRRVLLLCTTLGLEPRSSHRARSAEIARRLAHGDPGDAWLTLAVLSGQLPTRHHVERLLRDTVFHGPTKAIRMALRHQPLWLRTPWGRARLTVVVSTVIVDVHHTSHTNLATGIQRVARNAAREWTTAHDVLLVRWDKSGRNLRALTREERDNATGLDGSRGETPASPGHPALDAPSPRARLIPWGGTYILPELAIEDTRTNRIAALAEYSACRTVAIGFDCVPITTSETVAPGMGAGFSRYLSALTHFSAVAAISVAARDEFAGWRRMLAGAGLTGPDIREAVLPATAEESSPEDLAAARARFDVPSIPLVLCVGSHEPRKNHMAVLHAAEMLWRDGQHFTLVFVGGNAWRARPFLTKARELETAGRPVRIIAGAPDRVLWAAYRVATCTVFPSLNEGFGLPAAESIAVGTPVVTSNFGSMREIGGSGGAILIDPRREEEIARGISSILKDPERRRRLHDEALALRPRTWNEYAAEVWEYFHSVP